MQGAASSKFKWLVVTALAQLACRDHDQLCEGEACVAPASDQGGAPSEPPPNAAGGAGAAGSPTEEPPPECANDEDCDDERECNGLETCVDGRCSPGDDVECLHGTECAEGGADLCVYSRQSPWVIATSIESVVGLPLDQLELGGDMVLLGHDERTRVQTGFDGVWWSPDGQLAVVRSVEDRMGSRLRLLRFGIGLPSALEPIPDVPNWGDFWEAPIFSLDSKRMVVIDQYSGSYLVDLTDPAAPTTSLGGMDLPDSGVDSSIDGFCADASTWVALDEEGQYFLTTDDGDERVSIPLGDGQVTISPDARLIAVAVTSEDGEDSRIELRPCSPETWVAPLGPGYGVEFSPDSQWIAIELTEYDGGMSAVSLVDAEQPVTFWSDVEASPPVGPWFTSDSRRLMPELQASSNDEPTIHALDLGNGAIRSLGLPPYARVVAVGEQALLAWSTDFSSEPRDLLWQAFEREGAPVAVLSDSEEQLVSLRGIGFDPQSVFVSRSVDEGTEFAALRFDADEPRFSRSLLLPGSLNTVQAAPERRAVLVTTVTGLVAGELHWISLSEDGEITDARLLLDNCLSVSIQP